jgi:hypothetical protein
MGRWGDKRMIGRWGDWEIGRLIQCGIRNAECRMGNKDDHLALRVESENKGIRNKEMRG